MKKYAAIDIGTNSIRLLLATIKKGKITERKKYINTTRIGASVDKNKMISREGIEKNTETFCDFVEKAKEYGAEEILAIATSAVREAKNKEEFIQTVYQKTGINIKTISGEEEAELGYKGVIMGMRDMRTGHGNRLQGAGGQDFVSHLDGTKSLSPCLVPKLKCHSETDSINGAHEESIIVIDIGGGSTELILGEGKALKKTISLDIGAVRRDMGTGRLPHLKYKMGHSSCPPVPKLKCHSETDSMSSTHEESVKQCFAQSPCPVPTAIGIGGTITTLAAIHQKLDPYDPEKVHNYKLTLNDINDLKEKLLSLTTEQIKQLKGIHPKRADIITAGITILYAIMDSLNLKEIIVSEYDNLEGLLY